jgi:transcriptional regulator with XRE-family HTH domain/ketosteroid isomerase-like protein
LRDSKKAKRIVKLTSRKPGSLDIHFGEKLRVRRLMMAPKLSQDDLAKSVGISFQQVQKYEKGTTRISAATMVQLASVLEVDVQYFFDELPAGVKKNKEIKTPTLVEMSLAAHGPHLIDAFLKLKNDKLRALRSLISCRHWHESADPLCFVAMSTPLVRATPRATIPRPSQTNALRDRAGDRRRIGTLLRFISTLCLLLSMPVGAMAQDQADPSAEMQRHFAEAYNRGDVDAMVAAFTETAIRVTPSGIFEGRDAIRGSFQDAMKLGLHDYSVQRTISHSEGKFVFNAGKWQAKLGDHSFHGYYTAIVVLEGDKPKISEETVTVATP